MYDSMGDNTPAGEKERRRKIHEEKRGEEKRYMKKERKWCRGTWKKRRIARTDTRVNSWRAKRGMIVSEWVSERKREREQFSFVFYYKRYVRARCMSRFYPWALVIDVLHCPRWLAKTVRPRCMSDRHSEGGFNQTRRLPRAYPSSSSFLNYYSSSLLSEQKENVENANSQTWC